MSEPPILLTGADGQVGWELRRALASFGRVIATTRAELDLEDPAAIRSVVRALRPVAIVNAAAYTDVDGAQGERERAFAVNARAPGVLAEEAQRLGAVLLHYSTDYVFDGEKGAPYGEDDPPHPLNVYGESKLAGEIAVRAACERHLILRTSWVFGLRGRNFLTTILRLARERDVIEVVDDRWGCPTWSVALAQASGRVLQETLPPRTTARWGLYHLAASGRATWYTLARRALEIVGAERPTPCVVRPIPGAMRPAAAARPPMALLDCSLAARSLGLLLPDWQQQLEHCLASADAPARLQSSIASRHIP